MRNKSIFLVVFVLILAVALPAMAQDGPPAPELTGEIVLDGLNGPQGLHVDSEGNLWVIDGGFGGDEEINTFDVGTYEVIPARVGDTSQVYRLSPDGEIEVVASFASVAAGQDATGGARLIEVDGVIYATMGIWHINLGEEVTVPFHGEVVAIADGEVSTVASIWEHELANNPDGTTNVETHPYGIDVDVDGNLIVTDAAGNSLIRVNPETGETETIVGFEGIPGVFPSATRGGELLADPVPTNVVANEDGSFYVSYLSGAPFVPGSAKVVSVSADGEVSDFATGLTMLVDLKRGPDGNLYAVSFGMFTDQGPIPNSGQVIRIFEDGTWEVIVAGLPFATAIALDADGNGYVTINGIAIPGAGAVVYYEDMINMEAMDMPEMDMPDGPPPADNDPNATEEPAG